MQVYVPMRPHLTGHPQGGGYRCGACGLEGLAYGEPHYRSGDGSSSKVCEPAVQTVAQGHPQTSYVGKGVRARSAIGLGNGHLLERRHDDGSWKLADLGPPVAASAPTLIDADNTLEQPHVPGEPTNQATPGAVPVTQAPVLPDVSTQGGGALTTGATPPRVPTREEYAAAGYDPSTYDRSFGIPSADQVQTFAPPNPV